MALQGPDDERLHRAGKCWRGQQQARMLALAAMLRCNKTLFNFEGA